jgi:hypothetical protein
LSHTFARVRHSAVIAPDQLDLHAGGQLFFMFLDVEIDALLHLVSRLRQKT